LASITSAVQSVIRVIQAIVREAVDRMFERVFLYVGAAIEGFARRVAGKRIAPASDPLPPNASRADVLRSQIPATDAAALGFQDGLTRAILTRRADDLIKAFVQCFDTLEEQGKRLRDELREVEAAQ